MRINLTPEQRQEAKASSWKILRPGVKKREISLYGGTFIEHRWFCQDCKSEKALLDFVVYSSLWLKVMGAKKDPMALWGWPGKEETVSSNKAEGIICVHCFEKRLGRKLRLKDFVPDIGMNEKFFYGVRLVQSKD